MSLDDRSQLTDEEEEAISEAVDDELAYIQEYWSQLDLEEFKDSRLIEMMLKAAQRPEMPSRIPGHSVVSPMRPKVTSMIAVITDMRQSTDHLLNDYKLFSGPAKRLMRVHLETGALIAATATLVEMRGGDTPEFLGDGCLSFFEYDDTDAGQRIKTAYRCGCSIVSAVNRQVNPKLSKLGIPDIEVGVGIAASKSIVTVVGIQGNYLPKVIGECVYRASKCSSGYSAVVLDISARGMYPKSKGGKVKFDRFRTLHGKRKSVVFKESGVGRLPRKLFLEDNP